MPTLLQRIKRFFTQFYTLGLHKIKVNHRVRLNIILGPPRSGTTMLSGLIGQYPSYSMLPECSIIHQIMELHFRICCSEKNDRARYDAYFAKKSRADQFAAQAISTIIENAINIQGGGREYLTLKDPILTKFIKPLDRVLGYLGLPYKFIGIVRDPRDTLLSLSKVYLRKGKSPEDAFANACEDLDEYFRRMVDLQKENWSALLIVRYEEIVSGDEKTFSKIERHIGYKVSRKPYQERAFELDDQVKADPYFVESYRENQLLRNSVGQWRKELTDKQVGYIEENYRNYIDQFGYAFNSI